MLLLCVCFRATAADPIVTNVSPGKAEYTKPLTSNEPNAVRSIPGDCLAHYQLLSRLKLDNLNQDGTTTMNEVAVKITLDADALALGANGGKAYAEGRAQIDSFELKVAP